MGLKPHDFYCYKSKKSDNLLEKHRYWLYFRVKILKNAYKINRFGLNIVKGECS